MDAATFTPITTECQLAIAGRQTSRELRAQASTVRLNSARLHQQVRTFALRGIVPNRPGPDAESDASDHAASDHAASDHAASDHAASDGSTSGEFWRLKAEFDRLQSELEHLRAALATRDLIWEAKLIIAVAMGCDATQAHQVLVKQSQHENRKMREIAESIVQFQRA